MPSSDPRATDPDFDEVWTLADAVPGWLTKEQGRLLFDEAIGAGPAARLLEIGSHQGRSTVILGRVALAVAGEVIAIDPFVEGRLFGGLPTREKFRATVERAGVSAVVRPVEEYSTRARPGWQESVDLVYIDGKHDVWTFSDDLRWRTYLPPGGSVLVHDAFSSIGVTLGILLRVLPARDLTYVRRVGSMALFERRAPGPADRLRILRELPWWLRNVVLKVLLRLRLRPIARLLGHDSPYDPY
jgi:predicted O-methyltransferase YrrM